MPFYFNGKMIEEYRHNKYVVEQHFIVCVKKKVLLGESINNYLNG